MGQTCEDGMFQYHIHILLVVDIYLKFTELTHYQTTVGFVNIQCAMAMSFTKNNDTQMDVKQVLKNTYNNLQKSIDSGYTMVAG